MEGDRLIIGIVPGAHVRDKQKKAEMPKRANQKKEKVGYLAINSPSRSSPNSLQKAFFFITVTAIATVILALVAANFFTDQQMYILLPIMVAGVVFVIFSYVLWIRARGYLFGEIGFVYLALSLAYTISPAIKFLILNFRFPLDFDGLNFAVLSPQPAELGTHFWRHVLFISAVAAGYLAVRGAPVPIRSGNKKPVRISWPVIAIMFSVVAGCGLAVSLLSPAATTYIEHYTRFDNLSSILRKFVQFCQVFKSGGYFVLLALMFSQYRRYKMLIFVLVPAICAYEVVYSLGSRIVAFTMLMAFLGFYHFRVSPISLKKGAVLLIALALLFSGIGIIRSSNYSLQDAQYKVISQKDIRAMEFEAVYCTGFHLYVERARRSLPPRDWHMLIYELLSVIPFLDHTKYHPQYWYARHYFPEAVVPPQTMGVVADSAIWGGELDLLIRSLINGAIFALLTRWFLRRRDKWWALTIYIYCFATCIMTLKYSVLYQLSPLSRALLPPLLLTEVLFRFIRTPVFLERTHTAEPVAQTH